MKKLLNNKQVYAIVQAEEESGCSRLIFDLRLTPNAKVYCEVSKKGVIDIDTWEIEGE